MKIPTEPIGNVPRSATLLAGIKAFENGMIDDEEMEGLYKTALQDTVERLAEAGSPIVTDGGQTQPTLNYPFAGMEGLCANGIELKSINGTALQFPYIGQPSFTYQQYAGKNVEGLKKLTQLPIKQTVMSVCDLNLLYPKNGVPGYLRSQFIDDLINGAEADIRSCFKSGATKVQIDVTAARLALKLDGTKGKLCVFIYLNNKVLDRFTAKERENIGIHFCSGGHYGSTKTAGYSYTEFLPLLFQLKAGSFYLDFAGQKDKVAILKSIRKHIQPNQQVFLGVTNVNEPAIETAGSVRDLVLLASKYIPIAQLGTTDDCGFSTFVNTASDSRDIAFEKIKARVAGTLLAEEILFKKGKTIALKLLAVNGKHETLLRHTA